MKSISRIQVRPYKKYLTSEVRSYAKGISHNSDTHTHIHNHNHALMHTHTRAHILQNSFQDTVAGRPSSRSCGTGPVASCGNQSGWFPTYSKECLVDTPINKLLLLTQIRTQANAALNMHLKHAQSQNDEYSQVPWGSRPRRTSSLVMGGLA